MLQNHPGGPVTRAYLASLPTTPDVLAAIRKAHQAEQNMIAGAAPVEHIRTDLISDRAPIPLLKERDGPVIFTELRLSPCGRFIAASIEGEPEPDTEDLNVTVWEPYTGVPPTNSMRGLMLFDRDQGMRHMRYFSHCCRAPVMQWAQGAPHLSMVMLIGAEVDAGEEKVCEGFKVFVMDMEADEVTHELGMMNLAQLYIRWQQIYSQHEFDASGRYLMLIGHAEMEPDHNASLAVFDVWEDEMLCESHFSMAHMGDCMSAASWLPDPDLICIVLSYGVEMKEPDVFDDAGIMLVHLPDEYLLPGQRDLRFSPDGQKMICFHKEPVDSQDEYARELIEQGVNRHCLMYCRHTDDGPVFEPEYYIDATYAAWAPCSSKVVFHLDHGWVRTWARPPRPRSRILDIEGLDESVKFEGRVLGSDGCFSNSSRLVAAGGGGLRMLDVATGKQLWVNKTDLKDVGMALTFLPSGCGFICVQNEFTDDTHTKTVCLLHTLIFA